MAGWPRGDRDPVLKLRIFPRVALFEGYSDRAKRAIYFANIEAERIGALEIGIGHILLGVLDEDSLLFHSMLLNDSILATIRQAVEEPLIDTVSHSSPGKTYLPLSPSAKQAVLKATTLSRELGNNLVETEHVLLAVLKSSESEDWCFGILKGSKPTALKALTILNDNGLSAGKLLDRMATGSLSPEVRPTALGTKMFARLQKYYVPKHEYRAASPDEFPRLDIGFYDHIASILEGEGFSTIGDFEDLTASNAYPEHRRFYRTLFGDDGTIVALITHSRGSDIFDYMVWAKWLQSGRSGKSIHLETEFSDGLTIFTSNGADPRLTGPSLLEGRFISPGLSIVEVLAIHRARIAEYRESHPLTTPLAISTANDLEQHRHRVTELTSAHRKSLGGVYTREELTAMFKNRDGEFIEALYQRIRSLASESPRDGNSVVKSQS